MRTIKFRGKRLDNGEWVYGYLVVDPQQRHRIYWQPFSEASSNTYHFVDPETVGQFTGLFDKDGKEIYEGDVVIYEYAINVAVRYNGGAFGYWINEQERWKAFISFAGNSNFEFNRTNKSHQHEVIGNIHDNPELLK